MRTTLLVLIGFVSILLVGCGGPGGNSPVEPGSPTQSAQGVATNRYLWGLWEIRISADHQSAEVVPLRGAAMHLNTVRLLEHAACTNCLRIGNVKSYPPDELTVDFTLRHPYPGLLKYTGFDVRGIFISGADYTFPISGRSIAWGDEMARIMNADGYTSLFNPTEFPETTPPALGYIRGRYSTGGDLSATLNPYIAYAEDAPRRMFEAGSTQTRTVRLRLPDGPLEFGYAVDGCWQLVPGEVTDPLTDFPPQANCLEAYRIDVQVGPGLVPGGGSAPILADVYDHQGLDTISSVTLEAPDLFAGELALSFSTVTGEESFQFAGVIENEVGAGDGEYPLLVRMEDTESDQNLGVIDAWEVYRITVGAKKGWARTWGGLSDNYGYCVIVDDDGNIYVAGEFRDTADFDPGPETEEYTSNGWYDAYVSKFDSVGEFQWARTWGGTSTGERDFSSGVAVDDSGNVYVVGSFHGVVDFDPGPGVDEHEGLAYDVFLSKFDSEGEFQWARTWGGDIWDRGRVVATDAIGNIYVTGSFHSRVDFDPGPGEEHHSSNGLSDAFLSKFDSSGEFQWARTWGGSDNESGNAIDVDTAWSVYVTGEFEGTVDFDPGPDEHEATAIGHDVFLSKLDTTGNFHWVRTWGGYGENAGQGVAVGGFGNIYVTGQFEKTVDFDPGPDTEEHTANGSWDAFLSKFTSGGRFQWARTWGASWEDRGLDVAANDSGDVWVTGRFGLTVDFDPGPGVEEHTSNTYDDAFLSKFHSSGEFQWAGTWGGWLGDFGCGVTADGSGNSYVTGYFQGTVDFDPGPGSDIHDSNGTGHSFLSKFPPDGNW